MVVSVAVENIATTSPRMAYSSGSLPSARGRQSVEMMSSPSVGRALASRMIGSTTSSMVRTASRKRRSPGMGTAYGTAGISSRGSIAVVTVSSAALIRRASGTEIRSAKSTRMVVRRTIRVSSAPPSIGRPASAGSSHSSTASLIASAILSTSVSARLAVNNGCSAPRLDSQISPSATRMASPTIRRTGRQSNPSPSRV